MDAPEPTTLTWKAPGLWAMLCVHGCALLVFLPAAAPTAAALWLAAVLFVTRTFAVSAGYHRYFSHRAFRTSRAMQFLLAFVGGMGAMRGPLWWAAHHRQHHRYADVPGDPHSPMRGFFWAHLVWFVEARHQATRLALVRELAEYPELRFLDRHEWLPVACLIGLSFGVAGLPGFVWGANIGTLCLWHATFSLNSVTHRFGRRTYDTPDRSTNQPVIALLTFGEGWHNNHHRFPARARLGEGRQWDISWWGIALLQRLGLVWDVRT